LILFIIAGLEVYLVSLENSWLFSGELGEGKGSTFIPAQVPLPSINVGKYIGTYLPAEASTWGDADNLWKAPIAS
jgi:hypothetical protein